MPKTLGLALLALVVVSSGCPSASAPRGSHDDDRIAAIIDSLGIKQK